MENVAEITGHVRGSSPTAAARLEIEFVEVADSLAIFAERGRPVGRGRREIVIVRPYVMLYVVVGDEVRILSIRHGARRPA